MLFFCTIFLFLYNLACLAKIFVRWQIYTVTHTHIHTNIHTHTHTHNCTQRHAHTQKKNSLKKVMRDRKVGPANSTLSQRSQTFTFKHFDHYFQKKKKKNILFVAVVTIGLTFSKCVCIKKPLQTTLTHIRTTICHMSHMHNTPFAHSHLHTLAHMTPKHKKKKNCVFLKHLTAVSI